MAVRVVGRLLGRNVDAILFVLAAQRYALAARRKTSVFGSPDVSAAQLCAAVRDHALSHYGNRADALATLRFWRFERSEDLGQIVAALTEAGLMYPHPTESPAAFRGLFTLDESFNERR